MKKNFKILKTFFLICVLSAIVCTMTYAQEKTINIGFVGDFSDVSKAYTHNMYQAAQMAVNEFNATGGLFEKPVRLIQ